MMKNVLVPIDFSENAKNALKYAQVLFSDAACNFYLLHVNTLLNAQSKVTYKNSSEDSKSMLSSQLNKTKEQSTNDKHFFYAVYDYGFFVESIKKEVDEKHIDLIVMGTKGSAGLKEKILGSNTGDVITKVQCNTLVIPKEIAFSKPNEIAFPTDFNIFYSHGILSSISEMLEVNSGKIRIMNVLKQGVDLNEEQKKNKTYLFDFMEESFYGKYTFHSLSNTKVKAAIQCFVESRDIDMIVMVAKNLNFIQQILFDSIIEKMSFHTIVPFYVIHD